MVSIFKILMQPKKEAYSMVRSLKLSHNQHMIVDGGHSIHWKKVALKALIKLTLSWHIYEYVRNVP